MIMCTVLTHKKRQVGPNSTNATKYIFVVAENKLIQNPNIICSITTQLDYVASRDLKNCKQKTTRSLNSQVSVTSTFGEFSAANVAFYRHCSENVARVLAFIPCKKYGIGK